MNYSNGKNVFFALGLFLLLFVSSCKNEEDHSPCGRPDCSLTKMTYSEDGVIQHVITQTYTTAGGKKLLSETYWDISISNASVKIVNQYDNQARLTESSTTNTNSNGSNTSKVTYDYVASKPARANKVTYYGNTNNITGYSLYVYNGSLDKPTRQDYYSLADQITSHKEFTYDANGNLTEELDYSGTFLGSRTTYSSYTSDGEWQSKLYENFRTNPDVHLLATAKTTRVFENCTLKSELVETDGAFSHKFVNTIENSLIVAAKSVDAVGNPNTNGLTTYEYDCD